MATLFDAPSPSGRNNARLFLNSRGQLLDRYGRHWGGSQIRKMAFDALPPDFAAGGKSAEETDWGKQDRHDEARSDLRRFCSKHGLDVGQQKELSELFGRHLDRLPREAGAGTTDNAGPLSRHGVPGDSDDDDEVVEKVREYLSGHGLDDESIETALEKVKRDRAEAKDRLPVNALHGGMHGYRSGRSKDAEVDLSKEFPGSEYTTRDVYGAPTSEQYDPVRVQGERIGASMPGGGVTRRGYAGDMAFDEETERNIAAVGKQRLHFVRTTASTRVPN
jgi:hypothetical protein